MGVGGHPQTPAHTNTTPNNLTPNHSKKKSWQKAKAEKARQIKKRKGAAAKHKATGVAAVSGKRTKKSARKVARAEKLEGKEKAALESAMQVEGAASPAPANKSKRAVAVGGRKKVALKKGGGAKQQKQQQQQPAAAADAPEAMQE